MTRKTAYGPPSTTALPHRHGLQPGKPPGAPSRSRRDRRRPTRERGRPARMHSRCVPLSFPAMPHPVTLPVETAWTRPKQCPGAVAGLPGRRRWPWLCQDLCGRDARAPGGLHPMTPSQQRRSIGLCVCSWFVSNNHRQFLPPRILSQPSQRGCIHRQRQSNIRASDAGRQARPEGRPCHP